jgi:hypothetical protein
MFLHLMKYINDFVRYHTSAKTSKSYISDTISDRNEIVDFQNWKESRLP